MMASSSSAAVERAATTSMMDQGERGATFVPVARPPMSGQSLSATRFLRWTSRSIFLLPTRRQYSRPP